MLSHRDEFGARFWGGRPGWGRMADRIVCVTIAHACLQDQFVESVFMDLPFVCHGVAVSQMVQLLASIRNPAAHGITLSQEHQLIE